MGPITVIVSGAPGTCVGCSNAIGHSVNSTAISDLCTTKSASTWVGCRSILAGVRLDSTQSQRTIVRRTSQAIQRRCQRHLADALGVTDTYMLSPTPTDHSIQLPSLPLLIL